MSEANFINEIEFQEWKENLFPPFKGWDKIFLGWEKEVENLIKFYLKNKWIENWEDNAKRFKINCVLGNNGGGKTSLLKRIFNKLYINNDSSYEKDKKYEKDLITIKDNDNQFVFLDTFANLEIDIENSVNKNLLNKYNRNEFYKWFLKFRWKDTLLKWFFNKNFNIFFWISWFKKIDFWNNYISIEFIKLLKKYNIIYYDYINWDKNNYFRKHRKLNEFFLINYILEGFKFIVKEEREPRELFDKWIQKIERNNFLYVSWIKEYLRKYINLIENKYIKENLLEEYEKLINYKSSITNIEQLSYNFLWSKKNDFIKINKNDFNYIKDFSLYFDLDIKISDWKLEKSFENLSAWEKMILTRFTNIYMDISKEFETYKEKLKKENKKLKDNPFEIVILIDEPDLHLHLDWQKQYIQKLIDVFSTLDKNIKLHFIIATHSPFIISDLPTESIVVLDWNWKEEEIEIEENWKKKKVKQKFTKIRTYDWLDFNDWKYLDWSNWEKIKEFKDYENYFKSDKFKNKKTFWANFVDIIKDWFFFEDKVLMGSFAENVIWKIAKLERWKIRIQSDLFDLDNKEKLTEDEKKIKNNLKNKLENIEKELKNNIQENIWDDFLRDNLLYFKGKNNAKY